jgi:hypothetical protein
MCHLLIKTFADIGIVGTIEEQQCSEYINQVISQYKTDAQGMAGSPKFDIWVQQGTSSHRFDIMDKSKFPTLYICNIY